MINIIVVNGVGGSGKALCNSEWIPVPYGKKQVKDIKIGDSLIDRQGNFTKVIGVFPQGEKEVFEVTFKDGRKIRCSEDHLWNIHKHSWHREGTKNKFAPFSVKELLEEGIKLPSKDAGYRFSIQNNLPVNYPRYDYDIDPYVIGAFLGDGSCLERILTISSNDEEIVSEIARLLKANYSKIGEEDYSWKFQYKNSIFKNANNVPIKNIQTKDIFANYKDEICVYSYNKSIPSIYKYGSIEQRLSLLQGLMDTDGTITKRGQVTFTSTSKNLINDVQEVLHSLGYNSTVYEDTREKYTNKICYSLGVIMPNEEKYKLFRLKRKKDLAKNLAPSTSKYNKIKIVDIKKLNYKEEMTCFLVDNNEHLFLCGDYVVTHNTTFEDYFCDVADLMDDSATKYSMVTYVKKIAEYMGWNGGKTDRDRKFLSDLKIAMAEWKDLPRTDVKQAIEKADKNNYCYIFIDAREAEDIDWLKETYPGHVTTVLVNRGIDKKYGNIADDNVLNYNYDVCIENTGTLDDLRASAETFYEILNHPTHGN